MTTKKHTSKAAKGKPTRQECNVKARAAAIIADAKHYDIDTRCLI